MYKERVPKIYNTIFVREVGHRVIVDEDDRCSSSGSSK